MNPETVDFPISSISNTTIRILQANGSEKRLQAAIEQHQGKTRWRVEDGFTRVLGGEAPNFNWAQNALDAFRYLVNAEPPKKLNTSWYVLPEQELESYHGMEAESELVEAFANSFK